MKTILYIISLCALYVFLSVQIDVLAQSPAATRAYCDNNRNIAVQMTTQNLSTNLPIIVSQEVAKVSQSFVTNAYPVPVPVTNTVYVDTVISNQIIYQTTQTEVYATYSFVTNIYINNTTNINVIENTNITTEINFETNIIYQIGTNAILPNIEGSNFNFMVSDNHEYDMLFSTNSYGINMSLGRRYNGFNGMSSRYLPQTNAFGNLLPDIIYYQEMKKSDNYDYYLYADYGFSKQHSSFYIGNNIFNISMSGTLEPSQTNMYDNMFTASGKFCAMASNNFVIGNNISPLTSIDDIFIYSYEMNPDVSGSVILSAYTEFATNQIPYHIKNFCGFENCIVLDALSCTNNYRLSNGMIEGGRLKHKICISTERGIDDIMISENRAYYTFKDTYTPLSRIIGQMVTNIVNQMRPQ